MCLSGIDVAQREPNAEQGLRDKFGVLTPASSSCVQGFSAPLVPSPLRRGLEPSGMTCKRLHDLPGLAAARCPHVTAPSPSALASALHASFASCCLPACFAVHVLFLPVRRGLALSPTPVCSLRRMCPLLFPSSDSYCPHG